MTRIAILITVLAAVGLCGPARAFDPPPWTRPGDLSQASADLTTYQEWNFFSSPFGGNVPDVANINPNGDGDVLETSGTSFITSSGNIYSFSAPLQMHSTIPSYGFGAAFDTQFVVQVRTLGSTIVTDMLAVNGLETTTLAGYSYTELDRIPLGGEFGGDLIDHKWTFTAPGSAEEYELTWHSPEPSSSQDIIIVDTRTIAAAAPGIPGDTDGDGDVDLDDYDVLSGNMYTATAGGAADGDFNGDGFVTFDDFVVQALHFGIGEADETIDGLPGAPEPVSVVLFIFGAAALARTRGMCRVAGA